MRPTRPLRGDLIRAALPLRLVSNPRARIPPGQKRRLLLRFRVLPPPFWLTRRIALPALMIGRISDRRVLALELAKTGCSELFSQHFSSVVFWFRDRAGPTRIAASRSFFKLQRPDEGCVSVGRLTAPTPCRCAAPSPQKRVSPRPSWTSSALTDKSAAHPLLQLAQFA
jgi:hypothetical protein